MQMNIDYLKSAFSNAPGSEKRLLDQLLFLFELEKLKAELRNTVTFEDKALTVPRMANSAEHSWHITIFALLLHEYARGEVDVLHVMKMMLLHEVVEIDAGDTDVFSKDSSADVHNREARAADRIFSLLPEDQRVFYRALWDEFEENKTAEAKYARAIDRVHPILSSFLLGGTRWRERGITYDQMITTHGARIEAGAPKLWSTIKQCLDYGRDNRFFPPPVPNS